MNYKTTTLILAAFMLFIGCTDSKTQESAQAQTKKAVKVEQKVKAAPAPAKEILVKKDYTIEEIYNSMCIECHSADGSGNTEKLTPSMTTLTEQEIAEALKDVEADQGHVIMEHNRGEILKMGMEYSAEDMAKYMHKRFNNQAK